MEQKEIYQNYIDLLDSDASVRYKALLFKMNWILSQSFYIPYQFNDNPSSGLGGLNCFLSSCLQFKKLAHQNIETKETKEITDFFNERFRYIRFYSLVPQEKNTNLFFGKINFRLLNKELYKKLVACFFICLPKDAFVRSFSKTDLRTLFEKPVEGGIYDRVIIVDKNILDENGRIRTEGFTTVLLNSSMKEEEQDIIEQEAKKINIRTEVLNG